MKSTHNYRNDEYPNGSSSAPWTENKEGSRRTEVHNLDTGRSSSAPPWSIHRYIYWENKKAWTKPEARSSSAPGKPCFDPVTRIPAGHPTTYISDECGAVVPRYRPSHVRRKKDTSYNQTGSYINDFIYQAPIPFRDNGLTIVNALYSHNTDVSNVKIVRTSKYVSTCFSFINRCEELVYHLAWKNSAPILARIISQWRYNLCNVMLGHTYIMIVYNRKLNFVYTLYIMYVHKPNMACYTCMYVYVYKFNQVCTRKILTHFKE